MLTVPREIDAILSECTGEMVDRILEAAVASHAIDSRMGRMHEKRFRRVTAAYGALFRAAATREFIGGVVRQVADEVKTAADLAGITESTSDMVQERKVSWDEIVGETAQTATKKFMAPAIDYVEKRLIPAAEQAYQDALSYAYETSWNGKRTVSVAKAKTYARQRAKNLFDDLSGADNRRIGKAIADGIGRGDSIQTIADSIFDTVQDDTMTAERAKVIASTEANNALNAGAMAAGADMGYDSKIWVDVGDEKTCETCEGNAAIGVIAMGDTFPSGDAYPSAHPNCRCYARYVMADGSEPEL